MDRVARHHHSWRRKDPMVVVIDPRVFTLQPRSAFSIIRTSTHGIWQLAPAPSIPQTP